MTVKEVLNARFFRVWVILVLLAVVIPVVSVESHAGTATVVIVLALASIKVRYVGLDFMELRSAPWKSRLLFEVYCFALWAVLAGAYLWI